MTRRGGKPPSQRQLRVGEELRHVLAEILGRGELRDPELNARPITVTEVRVSPDLRNATAFVMPLGGAKSAEVLAALGRSAPYLRGVIGHSLRLRFVPQIGFELDHSFEHAQRIDELLHRPDVQKDLAPRADEEEGGGPPGDGA